MGKLRQWDVSTLTYAEDEEPVLCKELHLPIPRDAKEVSKQPKIAPFQGIICIARRGAMDI